MRSGCIDSTYHASVVLEVQEDTVGTLPGLGLADDDSRVDLLPQLRLALLHGSPGRTLAPCASLDPTRHLMLAGRGSPKLVHDVHDHIADTTSG